MDFVCTPIAELKKLSDETNKKRFTRVMQIIDTLQVGSAKNNICRSVMIDFTNKNNIDDGICQDDLLLLGDIVRCLEANGRTVKLGGSPVYYIIISW